MPTVDITTTQNVTIEYELGTVWDRIFASLIDATIVTIVWSMFFLFVIEAFSSTSAIIFWYSMLFIVDLAYHFFFEWYKNGQSPGKMAIGIKVVKLDGSEPKLTDYMTRTSFRLLDIYFTLGMLATLFSSGSTKRQRLGDLVANTGVIKVRSKFHLKLSDIKKISTLADHEVTYPAIRQFSEKDMLLIKSVISRYNKYRNDSHRNAVRATVNHMMEKLDLKERPKDSIKFLKTLITDYIVLTR